MNQQNNGPAESPEPTPIAAASPSPSASVKATTAKFVTEDVSVVASTTTSAAAAGQSPGVNANGIAIGNSPTTGMSVVSSAPMETISTTGAGSSLTQPIGIGSGKNYMNISFDGLFALAGSSAKDLNHIEVGDHDPLQRGFEPRGLRGFCITFNTCRSLGDTSCIAAMKWSSCGSAPEEPLASALDWALR